MSKKLKELRDKRGAKVERLQAIGGTLETRSLTPEEMTEYGAIQSELRGMDSEIQVLAETQALALALAAESGGEITSSERRELKRFSIMRGLQLLASGLPLDGIEKEVHDTAAAAARSQGVNVQGFAVPAFLNQRGQTVTLQTVNPGDQGGVTVETQVNGLIEALWSQSFLSQVGARRLVGLSGNQLFPVQLTKPVAQERTEIQTLTDQEILFGSVAMSPTRRGVTIPVSKQLMLQSSIDIEAFVIDMIRRSLDYKLNQDAITELLANITTANGNLLEIGTNGGALTYAHLVALETLLAAADVN